jgi:hypothetical protein
MNFGRGFAVIAQPKVNPQVAAEGIAHAVGHNFHLGPARGAADHPVTLASAKFQLQPMAARTAIHPQFHGPVERAHGNVDAPIVIEVRERRTL